MSSKKKIAASLTINEWAALFLALREFVKALEQERDEWYALTRVDENFSAALRRVECLDSRIEELTHIVSQIDAQFMHK